MGEKEFDTINVIPFIDIMLVLLTIVLTTSTFIARGGIPVQLPSAERSDSDLLRTAVIEIDRNGMVYFQSRQQSLADLQAQLQELDRETPLLLRADRNLLLQEFVDVLDLVKRLGFSRVSLQTEVRS